MYKIGEDQKMIPTHCSTLVERLKVESGGWMAIFNIFPDILPWKKLNKITTIHI